MEDSLENLEEMKLTTISSLIAQIHTEATNYLDAQLKAEGLSEITASHGYILFTLSKNKSEENFELKPMSMTEIAQKVDKDKSTTTVLIEKLIKFGYVQREKSQTDSRVSFISLSEKGKSVIEKMEQISVELSQKFYTGFTEEEKKTVFSLLKKIQSNFR